MTTRVNFFTRVSVLLVDIMSLSVISSATTVSSQTVAIVGAGVLGSSLCRQLLQDPDLINIHVTGITKTNERHDMIKQQVLSGFDSSKMNDRFSLQILSDVMASKQTYDHVIFCAPPSGFENYPQAIQDVAKNLWIGPESGGGGGRSFLFTSSGAVYSEETGTVSEITPVVSMDDAPNPRMARLLGAEEACFAMGGSVVRLAGLYNLQRGAHNFWITSGKEITGNPNGLINQVHYDDAAGACLAALKKSITNQHCQNDSQQQQQQQSHNKGHIYLVSDGHPLTRRQICRSALKASVYNDYIMPTFAMDTTNSEASSSSSQSTSSVIPIGKVYDCTQTYQQLDWKPKYESFDAFMTQQ